MAADPLTHIRQRDHDDEEPIAIPVTWYRGGTSKVFTISQDNKAYMFGLPTSDPGVTGQLYTLSGVLKVSGA